MKNMLVSILVPTCYPILGTFGTNMKHTEKMTFSYLDMLYFIGKLNVLRICEHSWTIGKIPGEIPMGHILGENIDMITIFFT